MNRKSERLIFFVSDPFVSYMFFVAILNVIGAILSPFLKSPKILPHEANLKDLYQPIPQNDIKNDFYPETTPKPEPTKLPSNTPTPTPTLSAKPIPTPIITMKPSPKPTPKYDINDKIAFITARFIDDYRKIKNTQGNVNNILKEIFNKVPNDSKSVLAKLKMMDYPIDYVVYNATLKVSFYKTTKSGFVIGVNKKNVINKFIFTPIANKSCSATKFTITTVTENEYMSFVINMQTGIPELYEFQLNLPIHCNKIIISSIETLGYSDIACIPYFGILGSDVEF